MTSPSMTLIDSKREEEMTKDRTMEALKGLLEVLKTYKAHFYEPPWTQRERDELMAAMSLGNAAALTPSPPAQEREWRTIESAPTDGTLVNLWVYSMLMKGPLVGKWVIADAFEDEHAEWCAFVPGLGQCSLREYRVTHWSPLPDDPPRPISSAELIRRCGGDPDAPFERGPFPPEMREKPNAD